MLDRLELPDDWKRRTLIFVTKANRRGVTPLVTREAYEADRRHPSRQAEFPAADQRLKARYPDTAS
jgi:hypothetical protein